MAQSASQTNQNKLDARQCLLAADKFIKDMQFVEAKKQIEKARSLDPTNIYISAFIDRINYFEQQKKTDQENKSKAAPAPKSTPPKPAEAEPVVTAKPSPPPVAAPPPPAPVERPLPPPVETPVPPPVQRPSPPPVERPLPPPVERPSPPPLERPSPPPVERPVPPPPRTPAPEPPRPVVPVTMRDPAPVPVSPNVVEAAAARVPANAPERNITESQLDEMKKQIELLSKALEQEKKAREEMNRKQDQQAITQFRTALEKAWTDSAPSEATMAELRQLAAAMSIPENVFSTLQREVKIEMYGRAVKEVISKRQLLRSSSQTLEWLRKVYQITLEEYLEYESKFLLDLVADQYKGTVIEISSDERTKSDITSKLKAQGYAVVTCPTPEDALEKIEKLNPNVVICESSFGPGTISGIRFLHILRTNSKFNFIPFIFLAAEEDIALLTASDLRPNEGYVKKPVQFDELSSLINTKLIWFREYIMSLSK